MMNVYVNFICDDYDLDNILKNVHLDLEEFITLMCFDPDKTYVYPSDVDVKTGDVVIVTNGTKTKYAVVIEKTNEQAKDKYKIVGKIDWGNSLEEKKRAARKARLLKYMQERTKEIESAKQFEEAAKTNPDIKDALDEYKSLIGM